MTALTREASLKQMEGSGGASHSFSEDEKEAFSEHINICLGRDPVLARHLPLDPTSMELFTKTQDGLILCKLINLASHEAIDERTMNVKDTLNIYQKTENQNLVLNAAKAIGCQIINIGSFDLIEGRPILVLGLVWQIIRIQLLGQISLRNIPELVLLLKDDETMADFLKLPPEVILLRWLNYHLHKAKSTRIAHNFTSDLCDCEIFSIVLNRLSNACELITSTDRVERAAQVSPPPPPIRPPPRCVCPCSPSAHCVPRGGIRSFCVVFAVNGAVRACVGARAGSVSADRRGLSALARANWHCAAPPSYSMPCAVSVGYPLAGCSRYRWTHAPALHKRSGCARCRRCPCLRPPPFPLLCTRSCSLCSLC